jgi:tRNA(Ile)-lysidine synthase
MVAQSDFLEHEVHTRWMPAAQRRGTQELLIPVQMIRDAPCAVQMELVRIVVGTLNPGLRDLAFRHVKQAVEFCLTPPRTGHAELALGLEMEVEGGMIVFRKTPGEPRPVPWEGETLPLPGRLCLQNPDMELEAAVLPAGEAPAVQPRMPRWQAWIDLDRVKLPLHVRTPRAGERWVPLGMEQPVRLANFLSAQHLPLPQRDRWPMVCDMDGIVWIPGMRIGARVRLTETTLRCLALRATTGPEEKNWAVTRKSTEP